MSKKLISIVGVTIDKIEALKKQYREKTGANITYGAIVMKLVENAKLKDIE